MVTGGDSSLVVDSMSPSGRVGSTAVPPSPPRTNALFSLTRFRNRLGTEMNEIIPNLFLGSLRDATDVEQLKKNRIQYVVSVHDLSARHPAHEHLKVLRIQLSDCSSSDISSHFAATNQFIHAARLKQAAVLVHCLAGVSRSATVVAAYLITVCDLSFLNALSLISRKRPVINPNFGFRMQLCSFADRCAVAERLRLREHFGWSFELCRCLIDWDSMGLDASQSCVATLPLSETGSACGPVTVTPVWRRRPPPSCRRPLCRYPSGRSSPGRYLCRSLIESRSFEFKMSSSDDEPLAAVAEKVKRKSMEEKERKVAKKESDVKKKKRKLQVSSSESNNDESDDDREHKGIQRKRKKPPLEDEFDSDEIPLGIATDDDAKEDQTENETTEPVVDEAFPVDNGPSTKGNGTNHCDDHIEHPCTSTSDEKDKKGSTSENEKKKAEESGDSEGEDTDKENTKRKKKNVKKVVEEDDDSEEVHDEPATAKKSKKGRKMARKPEDSEDESDDEKSMKKKRIRSKEKKEKGKKVNEPSGSGDESERSEHVESNNKRTNKDESMKAMEKEVSNKEDDSDGSDDDDNKNSRRRKDDSAKKKEEFLSSSEGDSDVGGDNEKSKQKKEEFKNEKEKETSSSEVDSDDSDDKQSKRKSESKKVKEKATSGSEVESDGGGDNHKPGRKKAGSKKSEEKVSSNEDESGDSDDNKKSKKKKEESEKKSGKRGRPRKDEKKGDSSQSHGAASTRLVKLKKMVTLAGFRIVYKKIFDGIDDNDRQRVKALEKEMERRGLTPPFTMESCKAFKLRKEQEAELAELAKNQIIDVGENQKGRVTRGQRSAALASRRRGGIIFEESSDEDEEEIEEREHMKQETQNIFKNLRGIVSDDADSD
ncbi:hypothetical protein Q1695_014749 [Nippostrongylus brasiliensis]|nr:hypothetical protein Q1695_014749 [Nippostrongylus brasiliensis]